MNNEFEINRYKVFKLFFTYEHYLTDNADKKIIYEYIDYDEIGLGLSYLCLVLIEKHIAITQEEYDFIKYLRDDLADDDDTDDYFHFKLTDLKVLNRSD